MKFTAEIQIIPLPEIYEPQGQTILRHLDQVQITGVQNLRVGKFVSLQLEAENEGAAQKTVEQVCQKLLAHPLIETYNFHLKIVEKITPEVKLEMPPVDTDISEPTEVPIAPPSTEEEE
jgi:phosphoribosylformylglycinamidine synthase